MKSLPVVDLKEPNPATNWDAPDIIIILRTHYRGCTGTDDRHFTPLPVFSTTGNRSVMEMEQWEIFFIRGVVERTG